nr:hypothetical protein [Tanacetum cinerariifolium]
RHIKRERGRRSAWERCLRSGSNNLSDGLNFCHRGEPASYIVPPGTFCEHRPGTKALAPAVSES